MRLSVQASLRLNHAIHQGNHRLDRPLHISAASGNVRPFDQLIKGAVMGRCGCGMGAWGHRALKYRATGSTV